MRTTVCLILLTLGLSLEAQTNGISRLPAPPHNLAGSGRWHDIRVRPRPGLPRIHFYNKLNPLWWLENCDEPVPPAWYHPHRRWRRLQWHLRNPFHNFDAYVIGVSDKIFVRAGRYPESISNPHGGWNFAVCKYKFLRLPFWSYRRAGLEFYIGWRERGNFGIKINHKRT